MTSPGEVPLFKVRNAIAEALGAHVKAQDLAAVCEYLGLAPQKPDEDPYNSKKSYVRARLLDMDLPALVTVVGAWSASTATRTCNGFWSH